MGVHYERARLLFRQGRYEQAERELHDELAETPHDGQTHAFLGRCLARRHLLAEALEEGREGVRLAPDLPYSHYMLALTCIDLGRPKDAEAALDEALRLDPRNPEQLSWLAWLQFQRGDRRAALATADRGLAIDPQHATCLNRRGYFLRWMGDWKGSEAALRAALAHAPEDGYTHTNLAWTLWTKAHAFVGAGGFFQPWGVSRRPELHEALAHFQEALRCDPGSDWAKTGVAEILLLRSRAAFRWLMGVTGAAVFFALFLSAYSKPPADDQRVMALLLLGFGVLTVAFADGPLYLLTRRSRLGSAVLSPGRFRAADRTAVCLAFAGAAGAAALFTPPPAALGVLFLGLVLVRPLGAACEASPGWPQRLMNAYAAAIAVAGLVLLAVACRSDEPGMVMATTVLAIGGGMASLRSPRVARYLEKQFAKRPG